MKKVFLAIVLLIGLTTFAQEKEGKKGNREKLTPEQRIDLQLKRMTKDLDLNEKQVTELRTLVTKQEEKREAKRAEIKEKRAKNAIKKEEVKAAIEKEKADNDAAMKKILTPDQYEKWVKIREERKANMREKLMERREENNLEKGAEPVKK
jgi:Spy/CpxP family protein refolding chaperone